MSVYLHIGVKRKEHRQRIKQAVQSLIDIRLKELKEICWERFNRGLSLDQLCSGIAERGTKATMNKDGGEALDASSVSSKVIPPIDPSINTSSFDNVCNRICESELLFDLSRLSCFSALTISLDLDDERHYPFLKLASESASSFDGVSPLISKFEWWDRPYWAWTRNEILLSEAAIFAATLDANDDTITKCSMTVATHAAVARLPFLASRQYALLAIDHQLDYDFIKNELATLQKSTKQGKDPAFARDIEWLEHNYFEREWRKTKPLNAMGMNLPLQPERENEELETLDSTDSEAGYSEEEFHEHEESIMSESSMLLSKETPITKARAMNLKAVGYQPEDQENALIQFAQNSASPTRDVYTPKRAADAINIPSVQPVPISIDVQDTSNKEGTEKEGFKASVALSTKKIPQDENSNIDTIHAQSTELPLSNKAVSVGDTSPTPTPTDRVGIDLTAINGADDRMLGKSEAIAVDMRERQSEKDNVSILTPSEACQESPVLADSLGHNAKVPSSPKSLKCTMKSQGIDLTVSDDEGRGETAVIQSSTAHSNKCTNDVTTRLDSGTVVSLSQLEVDVQICANSPKHDWEVTHVTQVAPRSPQIDSQGIDLAVLSELPLSLRSEARLAHFLGTETNGTAKKRKGPMHKWMVDTSLIEKAPREGLSLNTKRKKHPTGIATFFRSKAYN